MHRGAADLQLGGNVGFGQFFSGVQKHLPYISRKDPVNKRTGGFFRGTYTAYIRLHWLSAPFCFIIRIESLLPHPVVEADPAYRHSFAHAVPQVHL